MSTRVITLDGPTLLNSLTMQVQIKRMCQVRWRLALCVWLVTLAARIGGMAIEVGVDEPD